MSDIRRLKKNKLTLFVCRVHKYLPTRATHLSGYEIEYTVIDDTGHDVSFLVTPSEKRFNVRDNAFCWALWEVIQLSNSSNLGAR